MKVRAGTGASKAKDAAQAGREAAGAAVAALRRARCQSVPFAHADVDLLNALVRTVSDVITILDDDGTIRYASPSVQAAWGCSVCDLLGQCISERTHPRDTEAMRALLSRLLKQPSATLTGTARLRRGAHTWRDFEIILTNLLDEPAIAGIVATYHDVTERKQHEHELTKLAAAAMARLEREMELRRALERRELRVFYQPIVALEDRSIRKVEALVRWQHPERGLVSPADIIPIAEETGLIMELGQWVLDEACRQGAAWHQRFPTRPPLALCVNLSARQFRREVLVSEIRAALRDSGLPPASLTLEITETSLIDDPADAIVKLKALRDTGVRLAIDDFGVGYSSLSYLKLYPVDTLKIDRSFVQGIDEAPRDRAIARSLIALAAALDLEVIGEGVETEEQAAELRRLGCTRAQGNLFAKPLPAEAMEALIGGSGGGMSRAGCV